MTTYWAQIDLAVTRKTGRFVPDFYVEYDADLLTVIGTTFFENATERILEGLGYDPEFKHHVLAWNSGTRSLQDVAQWLYNNEYEDDFQGLDAWIARVLAEGARFVPIEETRELLSRKEES
jgi:hypothetical protein